MQTCLHGGLDPQGSLLARPPVLGLQRRRRVAPLTCWRTDASADAAWISGQTVGRWACRRSRQRSPRVLGEGVGLDRLNRPVRKRQEDGVEPWVVGGTGAMAGRLPQDAVPFDLPLGKQRIE